MANPPITIGPFDNVPAPGSPIRSDWPQEISNYVVDVGRRVVRSLPLVRTNVQTTPFTLPTDPVARTYVIGWAWWAYGMNANGTMRVSVRIQGGADLGIYDIPYSAAAPPVPTLSATNYFRVAQAAGAAAVTLEAVITGGTGAWAADGYLNAVGYADVPAAQVLPA
jgi:hypothetical protein